MTKSQSFKANIPDGQKRIDIVLAEHGAYPSRSAAAKMCETGHVFVNGQSASKKTLVSSGDYIFYEIPEVAPHVLKGEPIELDIRYEDDSLLVLSKPAGLVCHPSPDHANHTLVNALIYHCGFEHLCNVQGDDDRPGLVHRLDMDTSGLMLAAKTDESGYALMDSIRERSVDRHYIALVHGLISSETGMIDAPIARHASDRLRMAIRDTESARDALTTFQVLERFEAYSKDNGYTLIDCKLYTGRTHQIRVHMEYARHPLVGDPLYTSNAPRHTSANLGLDRQFLHSYSLGFTHPASGEQLHFYDQLPADLMEIYLSLASRSMGKTLTGEQLWNELQGQPVPNCARLYFSS